MSAVSPAVTNGPSEQNGEGEQVWERPWSLEEIRKTSANWSLAADSGLFLFLQDFSQRMLSKTHEIEKQLDGLIRDTKATDCCLHTVFNDFLMLSNTQFIENRVYDEEVEEPVSKPEAVERPPEQEKTREQKEAELIPKVQEAVNYGLRVLESAFEQLDIKAGNSDSEDEEVADRVEPILEPKDLYVDRPLPYLIGSQHFMEQDDVGLGDLSSEEMSIDSDRDSVIDSDEDKNDDQSDYQSEEGQGSIKKKSSIASDEDEEEDDEEEDSDIFGDSDKDENEDGKSSTGPSSFADELAARIKGEVPHKPEEDRASLKSSASATKRKSKGKKEPKAAKPQVAPDNDDMFSPPKMEDEDYSPFGGKGGLFSGGRGLFDDDDEGDLFSDAPKQEQRVASPAPAAKDPVSSKSNKKIPTGAVSIFPEGSLFGSPANGSDSLEDRENGGPAKPRPAPKQAPKQAPVGGLFDDDEDDDDFFSGSTLKKSASAGHEKPKQKKAVDLFGGDGDDEDDGDGDIFGEASGVPPSKQSPKEEETAAPAPEKKMPAGAISMFGPGTKNVLVEGLKRRQHSTSEESEKAEENVPGGDVAKPSPKPAGKPQTRGLFSDDEDTQIFPSAAKPQTKAEPVVQSKPSKALSIFDDEEEEDLFSSGPPKSKTNQAKSTSVQKPSKPVSSGLFSDDEDQWMSSKPSEAKPDVKTGGMRGSNSAPSSLPSARAAQKDSLFDEDDHDLFTATKETSKKKSQRVSLLFEEEEEDEEGRGSLFGFQPPAPKSSAPDVKATDAEPPSRVDEEKEKEEDTQSSPQESVEPKKKPAGAVSLFGGIDVLGQKEEVAKPTKTPLEDPDKDDFLYRDSPPPMDEEPRAKKNVVSLFDNDDEDEEEEEEAVSVSSQPAAKNTLKDQEQKTRTKSTRVFQDEELLFTQKLQKDNDPDVDLFSTSVNPASLPPSSVKAGAPMLFGDEDEDDLFSSAKPKAPPKVAEKPRIEEPPVKPVSLPVSGDAEKPTSPVKSKEPSSRIGKLQANLAISPAQLLPGAVPRMPGAVSVFPGLSPTSPSPPSFSSSSSSSSSALTQTPSPASSSAPQAGREGGVSFDGPAQVTTLQSTNKGRAKGAGRRRPQTRAARQLAAQLSDELREEGQEEAGSGGAGAGGAGSGAAPLTDAPPNPSALRLPIFPPAETQGAKPKKPRPPATTAPAAVEEDPFASGDLFAPASKQTPSPKPKSASPEQAPSQALKKEDVPAIFDNPGGDLFQAAKHKPAKKPKAAAFLEEEDHNIFGGGKSTTVTLTKEPPAESNPSKQDIFQDEKQEAPKKRKGKALDTSLFDDNVDIFADLTTTTKPKEKKSKKKVETKSIFDDDMDDIFSSGTVKPVVKPQSKSKKPQPSKDTTVAEETNHSIFDDPLNALGGN